MAICLWIHKLPLWLSAIGVIAISSKHLCGHKHSVMTGTFISNEKLIRNTATSHMQWICPFFMF